MGSIVFITGGSRSGKSEYAVKIGEYIPSPRAFIATCPVNTDEEMLERISVHKKVREKSNWDTIEEAVNISQIIRAKKQYNVFLIDCLTLWVHNLMEEHRNLSLDFKEEEIEQKSRELLSACAAFPGTVIFVSNEVGMGLVPPDPYSRRFRDLAGRCNQTIADGADRVAFMVSGLPLYIKN